MLAPAPNPDRLTDAPQRHMIQLDGLRTLAVLVVMHEHWSATKELRWLPWGTIGVQLFFVLSGFLITGILLQQRSDEPGRRTFALKAFYCRRFLRIFPLYYAVLAIGFLVGPAVFRDNIGWHFFYLSNFLFYLTESWHGAAGHFWSLAVEEQFYLAWPLLMLYLPTRALLPVILGSIGLAPLFRIAMALPLTDQHSVAVIVTNMLTPSCLDALGFGALLAYWGPTSPAGLRLRRWGLFGALPLWLAIWIWDRLGGESVPLYQFSRTLLVAAFAGVIGGAAVGFPGLVGRFLSWRPVTYLGTISYGLYVLHLLVGYVASKLAGAGLIPAAIVGVPVIWPLVLFLFTLVASMLSWHLFEKPLNDLKRHFPYRRPA